MRKLLAFGVLLSVGASLGGVLDAVRLQGTADRAYESRDLVRQAE